MELKREIEAANKIAYSKYSERPSFLRGVNQGTFNPYSFIFRCTNEVINSKEYTDCLKDRNKILSVIASGDQILNSILYGAKDIDGFDISIFPKYYLNLKIAAIKELNSKDYIEFFYGKNAFNRKVYNKISKNLNPNNKEFWDTLINNPKSKKLAASELFCTEFVDKEDAKYYNPYLYEENYNELKSKINNINIRYHNGDIFELCKKLRKGYDLVNLSSIMFCEVCPPPFDKQKKLYSKFSLGDNGLLLSYVFNTDYNMRFTGWNELPKEDNFYYVDVEDIDGKKNDGLILYKKIKQ